MINMANMTTRRTDREVLTIIHEAVSKDEVVSIHAIASQIDCHPLTVIRSVARLESLERLEVDRTKKPNRYRVNA